jgi:trk system potassium uptake protein TrkH
MAGSALACGVSFDQCFLQRGFSTFSDNLMGFQQSPMILMTVCGLIVLGGLGFLTHEELLQTVKSRRAKKLIGCRLQSRIVIVTTLVLIVGGWIVLTVLEWDRTLSELPVHHKIVNGLMMSITTRTAGSIRSTTARLRRAPIWSRCC